MLRSIGLVAAFPHLATGPSEQFCHAGGRPSLGRPCNLDGMLQFVGEQSGLLPPRAPPGIHLDPQEAVSCPGADEAEVRVAWPLVRHLPRRDDEDDHAAARFLRESRETLANPRGPRVPAAVPRGLRSGFWDCGNVPGDFLRLNGQGARQTERQAGDCDARRHTPAFPARGMRTTVASSGGSPRPPSTFVPDTARGKAAACDEKVTCV